MKYLSICLLLCFFFSANAQTNIEGVVVDKKGTALVGANVYIKGSVEGTSSDLNGRFSFVTTISDGAILVVSCIGYQPYEISIMKEGVEDLVVVLKEQLQSIKEVQISASHFNLGKRGSLKKMDAMEVMLSAASQGDIINAMQSLPGTQKVGEDGRLYVRGGESRETQVFIDGMHVLFPYSSTAKNIPSRSRFSSFLFEGINFSLGGYGSEYGQALSSVLPMDTKKITSTKAGVHFSPLGMGGGGTYSWGNHSISGNISYTDLSGYNKINPDIYHWSNDYRNYTGDVQFKSNLSPKTMFKLYLGRDKTSFGQYIEERDVVRDQQFDGHSDYLNTTLTTKTSNGFHLFLGASCSNAVLKNSNVIQNGDGYREHHSEWHLKGRFDRYFSDRYRLMGGMETYLHNYEDHYKDTRRLYSVDHGIDQKLYACFLDNRFRVLPNFYLNVSSRFEYHNYYNQWRWLPRISLNYINKGFQLSAIAGKYDQIQSLPLLVLNNHFNRTESADHYIFGASYHLNKTLLKIELYRKDYRGLPLKQKLGYQSNGYGQSKGIDIFYMGETFSHRLNYTLSYSYNDTQKHYMDYPMIATPTYATLHNASLNLKYEFPSIKTFVGTAYSFASGRNYHNPNKGGFMNGKTSAFHNLDFNVTYLLSKRVILHAFCTNILGTRHTYGYHYSKQADSNGVYASTPIVDSRKRFFYLGVFISLKSNSAYEISNF